MLNYSFRTGTFAPISNTNHWLYHIYKHPGLSTFHSILQLSRRWQMCPVSDLETVGRERGSWSSSLSITLCFSLQSQAARRLTHSLRDTVDNSQSGKCDWIPNENRSSLCFINCCYDLHFQISHIPLTNRERRKMFDCHCFFKTTRFLFLFYYILESEDTHVEFFDIFAVLEDTKF